MSLVLDEHRQYLSDAPRLNGFSRAISSAVRPGDAVLDLGSGTGILGLLACRAGARVVYAIEAGDIAGLTAEVAAANGFADRVVVVRELSTRVVLPERVDVIVTDQIGRFGIEAEYLKVVGDARRRLLKPGGRIVPAAITLQVALCSAPHVPAAVDFWRSSPAGFDFSRVTPLAASTGYPGDLTASSRLTASTDILTISPDSDDAVLTGEGAVSVERAGVAHALGGWFAATLAPGVTMTNAPGHPERINRRQVLFPLQEPAALEVDDSIRIRLRVHPIDIFVAWQVEIRRRGAVVHRTERSTLGGMLLSPADLVSSSPAWRPRLTAAGEARRSVLELANGDRTLEQIEREVAERHRDLLPTAADAAGFVAEVLGRYGR